MLLRTVTNGVAGALRWGATLSRIGRINLAGHLLAHRPPVLLRTLPEASIEARIAHEPRLLDKHPNKIQSIAR